VPEPNNPVISYCSLHSYLGHSICGKVASFLREVVTIAVCLPFYFLIFLLIQQSSKVFQPKPRTISGVLAQLNPAVLTKEQDDIFPAQHLTSLCHMQGKMSSYINDLPTDFEASKGNEMTFSPLSILHHCTVCRGKMSPDSYRDNAND